VAPPGLGWQWQKLRRRLLLGRPRCHWCGAQATTIDHVVPRRLGGALYDPRNLVPSCLPCNGRRGGELAKSLGLGRHAGGKRERQVRRGAIED
jgi:5-methylcytosine-specific restriction endonuclease McrA